MANQNPMTRSAASEDGQTIRLVDPDQVMFLVARSHDWVKTEQDQRGKVAFFFPSSIGSELEAYINDAEVGIQRLLRARERVFAEIRAVKDAFPTEVR